MIKIWSMHFCRKTKVTSYFHVTQFLKHGCGLRPGLLWPMLPYGCSNPSSRLHYLKLPAIKTTLKNLITLMTQSITWLPAVSEARIASVGPSSSFIYPVIDPRCSLKKASKFLQISENWRIPHGLFQHFYASLTYLPLDNWALLYYSL